MTPYEEALERLLAAARPVAATETLALEPHPERLLGRILAAPLVAVQDLPPFDNSAMDGYAVAGLTLAPGESRTLPVALRLAAGDSFTESPPALPAGTAARVFTGAPLPRGADTVVCQEQCEEIPGEGTSGQVTIRVKIRGPVQPGSHVRRRGEDLRQGTVVLEAGTRLQPQHLGLAAASGSAALEVHRRVRVATLFTGNELVPAGRPLQAGQIYDSNRPMLLGLLQRLGCEVRDLGIVGDDYQATLTTLAQAAGEADLVLTSGGASVGETDHVKQAVASLGRLELWRVAIKPGKPLLFGRIGETLVLGLPGNPASLFVTFVLFARPLLRRLQGAGDGRPRRLWGRARFARHNRGDRCEFLRARLHFDRADHPVELHPRQDSAGLSAVAWANCLAVVPAGASLEPGDPVEVLLFED